MSVGEALQGKEGVMGVAYRVNYPPGQPGVMVVSSIIRRFEASEWQRLEVEVEIEVEVEVVLSTVHPSLDTLSYSTMVLLLRRCSESKEASNQACLYCLSR